MGLKWGLGTAKGWIQPELGLVHRHQFSVESLHAGNGSPKSSEGAVKQVGRCWDGMAGCLFA